MNRCPAAIRLVAAWAAVTVTVRAAADLETAGRSVVVLREHDGAVRGTGFVWPSKGYVVTAYHVVAGVSTVGVSYHDGADSHRAVVAKALRARDLVLLRVADAEARPVAAVRADPIQPAMRIRAYARGLGINELTAWTGNIREVKVTTTLRQFLTSQARASIERAGFPDLDSKILACELSVRPGASGAPAFDDDGRVCGVVLGGLESGLGAVSWLAPATVLQELQAAPEVTDPGEIAEDRHRSEIAFSADAVVGTTAEEEISGLRVVKLRTRTLRQITGSNFDPLGLNAVVSVLASRNNGWFMPDWSSERFDIYSVEPANAPRGREPALVVVPSGVTITADTDENGGLNAEDANGAFSWRLRRQTVTPAYTWGMMEAMEFERALGVYGWATDPQFSDMLPVTTRSNTLVQRRAFVNWVPGATVYGYVPQMRGIAAVAHTGRRNLATGGGTLMSSGVICPDWLSAYNADNQKRLSLWTVAVYASGFGNTDMSSVGGER